MKEKLLKIKYFVLHKLLPIICVMSLLMSFLVIVPSASVITDNEFFISANKYTDFFVLASAPYNNEFSFDYTNNPEWSSPALRSNSIQSAIDILTLQFQYSNTLKQWFNNNIVSGQSVEVVLPFVFYNSSSSTNYYPPFDADVFYINSSGISVNLGHFQPTYTTTSYVVFNFKFEFVNDFTAVSSNSPIIRIDFNVSSNGRVTDEVYCGLNTYPIGDAGEFNKISFSGLTIPDYPNKWDPDNDIFNKDFGNGLNDYFATEQELNEIVDHNWINSFFANFSAIENEAFGLGAVRRIMNEFFNYNGSQYTWLSNLLNISLYLGMISFVLGFSVYFMGSIRGKKK